MKLQSMKLPPMKKEQSMIGPSRADSPRYPYGLRLDLETEALDKLNLTKLPQVGTTIVVVAKAKVVTVSQTDSTERKNRRLELQITDLGFDTDTKVSAADKLFGGTKK